MLIGFIIIIVLVHFLIIRPLTQRNRSQRYESRRDIYNQRQDYYGPGSRGINGMSEGGGMGRFGTFAGGLATGALLTYLLDQGRIGFDQFQYYQNMQDHELMRELQDQNILQQDEIDQLREGIGQQDEDGGQNEDNEQNNYEGTDNTPDDQQDNNDFGGWDNNSDDNWL
ncbi:hypothetical protein [Neobacillus terrae]|uniref:hypothetical protein n=1 Tax=Neobacillus terrae TaxID=3034837 RepID=UPI00140E7F2B|nr:hypothetical protein [Neobacillus terrae]NHM31953.1 hypothetical protein [Neobacillus terrae]